MALTPDEQKTFDELQRKATEPEIRVGEKVIRLIPGGKRDDTPIVEKLRQILRDAEAGRYEDFVFIGAVFGTDTGDLRWTTSAGSMTLKMWGAITRAIHFLHGQ